MAQRAGRRRCAMPCWIHVVGLLACLALAVAQAPTPAASTPALALPAASAAGTKLTPAEVDAAVDQVKSNLPADQTLTPAQLAQLRAALAQVNRATLVRVSTTAGGTTKPAANAAGSLPPDVLNGLLVGLRTTNGSMATNTSSVNVTEAQAVLSPPQDCPGFSCVCRQQRSGARVAAPSDCTGFVTCDGRGSGNKTLCAVGLGFRAESSSCAPLSSSSSGGKRCVFATAGAQAIVPVVPPPPTKKPATAAAARPANLTAVTPSLTWTCGQTTPGINVTLVNLAPGRPNAALAGQSLCRLVNKDQQGSITIRLTDPRMAMTTIAASYFEGGYGAELAYTTGYKRESVTSNETTAVPLLDGAGGSQVAMWAPRMALFRCPNLPSFLTLRIVPAATGSLQLSKLVITFTAAPASLDQNNTMKEPPKNVVVPRPSQLMMPGSYNSAQIVAAATKKTGPGGRRLTGDQQLGSAIRWATKLAKNMPKFISKANSLIDKANKVYDAYKQVMGTLLVGTQCYRQSYNRGVGTIPTSCSGGWEYSVGLCYEPCRANYDPVNFVCWERCKAGWADHGVTCHIPMYTVTNNDNGCSWFDICATWHNRGCRRCNPGFNRDGCLCTRPPRWQTKATNVRASRRPDCSGGREWQNGLCYSPCNYGYWGESFLCYNNCPDAFPWSCGIGLCTKSEKVCAEFVTEAVLTVVSFVGSLASTIASGGSGIVGTLMAAADVVMFFKDTTTCEAQGIHLPSNMAVSEVKDREYQGYDLFALTGATWDTCLVACKNSPTCDFVVLAGTTCLGRRNIGDGPNGANQYAAGIRTGVAVMRTPEDRINWMWADGSGAALGGELLKMEDGTVVLVHGTEDGPNLLVCMVACLSNKSCTHFVYNDIRCWMMNTFGANKRTWAPGDTYLDPGTGAAVPGPNNTMVNVLLWPGFDAPA